MTPVQAARCCESRKTEKLNAERRVAVTLQLKDIKTNLATRIKSL